jgi:hypothetical protein
MPRRVASGRASGPSLEIAAAAPKLYIKPLEKISNKLTIEHQRRRWRRRGRRVVSPPSDSLGYQPVKEEWLTWWSFKAFKLNTLPRANAPRRSSFGVLCREALFDSSEQPPSPLFHDTQ